MGWRLFWAFQLILTLVLVLSLAIWWLSQHQLSAPVRSAASAATRLSDDTATAILNAAASLRGYLLSGDSAELAAYEAAVATYTANLAHINQDPNRPDTAPHWREIDQILAAQRSEFDARSIALRQAVDAGQAPASELTALTEVLTAEARLATVISLLATIDDLDDARAAQLDAAARAQTQRLEAVIIGGAALIIIAGLLLTLLIIRNISAPIARLSRAASAIAAGNLDQRVGWSGNDEVGRMAGAFDAMADQLQAQIATQEAALAASRRQEATLRTIIESVGVGILLLDGEDRLVVANSALATLLAVSPAVFQRGTPMSELSHAFPAPIRAVIDQLDRATPDREPGPTVVIQPPPFTRALEVSLATVGNPGQPRLGHIWLVRDVTRDHAVNEMKTEFVSMVAHELRTPLTSVKGYVDLLLENEVGELNEDQRAFLTIVASSTDRLVSLISNVLDVSRIEAGQIALNAAPVDLRQTLSAVGAALRPLLAEKDQQFALILPDTPLVVSGDADRLTQIFTNLLSNAQKYSPPGSEIRIRAEMSATEITIAVIDQGIGLTEEEQAQLFTRFFRAANRTVQAAGGTGLGLAITRSLVELHGGAISVVSQANAGTTFRVRLPRLAAPPLTVEAPGSLPKGHADPAPAPAPPDVGPAVSATAVEVVPRSPIVASTLP